MRLVLSRTGGARSRGYKRRARARESLFVCSSLRATPPPPRKKALDLPFIDARRGSRCTMGCSYALTCLVEKCLSPVYMLMWLSEKCLSPEYAITWPSEKCLSPVEAQLAVRLGSCGRLLASVGG
jgi:hypothetical protein